VSAEAVPFIEVWNKIDLLGGQGDGVTPAGTVAATIPVSARTGEGLDQLRLVVEAALTAGSRTYRVRISRAEGGEVGWLYGHAEVIGRAESDDEAQVCEVRVEPRHKAAFTPRFAGRFEASDAASRSALVAGPDLVPVAVQALQPRLRHRHPLGPRPLLDIMEAPGELAIGVPQCRLRIDAQLARQVRRREQQVADLLRDLLLFSAFGDFGHLVQFLAHLVEGLLPVRPVELHRRRALAQLFGARQLGQGVRHVIEQRRCLLSLRGLARPLVALDLLP